MQVVKVLLGIACVLGATCATAQSIGLGDFAYGGAGCPKGSVLVTLSDDATRLTIDLAPQTTGIVSNVTCHIAVPLVVPTGYRGAVAVSQVPPDAELFFAGFWRPGPQVWSRCGEDIVLRAKMNLAPADTMPVEVFYALAWQRCS